MLEVNTIKTGGHVRAEQLKRIGVSLRQGSGILPPISDNFPVESALSTGDVLKAAEVASSTPAANALFSLLKIERVLLPFDFTAASVRLLQWLTRSTDETAIRLSVLHAVHPWVPPNRYEPHYPFDPNMDRIKAARALLRRLLGKTSCRLDAHSVHVIIGPPGDVIVRFARSTKTDLIVMASRRNRKLKDFFFSATTESVKRRAPCPVLILPEAVLASRGKPGSAILAIDGNAGALVRHHQRRASAARSGSTRTHY